MRILVATYSTHRIGGVETYLGDIIPALRAAGHEVAIACEQRATPTGDSLLGQEELEIFCASDGRDTALDALRHWRPDLVYAHGMQDARLEARIAQVAPTVFFVHNYHGTCISGAKRFAFPVLRPCDRTFGASCLACYYPRRCGGLSPLTMWRQFVAQRRRLRTVRSCAAVVTHSFHMYSEYARHGVPLQRLHRFVYFSPQQGRIALPVVEPDAAVHRKLSPWQRPASGPLRLAFAGRLDLNKGVHLLIDAAPDVARRLRRSLVVTIAGDGPARAQLERSARRVQAACSMVRFDFTGWLSHEEVAAHLGEADVVVFPSAWPEPFGLVGPEAGHLGVPVAAFAVGGVRGWLVDGVNGYLAPGNPPTAEGLAAAIAACLRDERTYQRLRLGAVEMAQRFGRGNHLQELLVVFERVLAERKVAASISNAANESLSGGAIAIDRP